MANVTKISVALTSELAKLMRQAVKSGDYASTSEVVREALREWKLRRSLRRDERDVLLRLWQEGLESGPGRLRDIKAIKREARRRFAERAGNGNR